MDEKGVSGSFVVVSKENNDTLYPMFFGVSCALSALKLMPDHEICDNRWSEIRTHMLKGSVHLLGLLVWTVQKKAVDTQKSQLENVIAQLRKIRSEDAKANEKVVSIFAAREQGWFEERRSLRQQIGALMNDLRLMETKQEESVSEFGEKMKEIEVVLQLKDKVIEEAEQKRSEAVEKLKEAERVVEELRENVEREAQRHSSDVSKQKTAFMELVSNHRQLEAELGRAVKEIEAAKRELGSVLGQKEELGLVNQRLSTEIVKMRKNLEQKDQILSAMLRKSRLDTAEKQLLLKEVKSSKAKRMEAEVEMEKRKAASESKHERYSLRSMLSNGGVYRSWKNENKQPETRKGTEPKLTADDAKQLENWVNSAAEKYRLAIEQRHQVENDAFLEQLRQKDEKLEAYSWRLISMELECKRLQSHIESLNHEIKQLRQDNTKLQAILTDRDPVQEQLSPPKPRAKPSQHDADWSRVKIVKRKPAQKRKDIILTIESPKEGKDSAWKMDIHALGISYKVKRLKQQLLMLERVTGKKESCENKEPCYALMSLLNKQADRYQSLQAKIDHLCMRMHENNVNMKSGGSRAEEETKRMEYFLEETFQVQRYIVATGQKLIQLQSEIASGLVGDAEDVERPDAKRFSDGIKTLFQEVQRGLEVRISRIIGDLEGTLTRDGFDTSRKL